MNKNKISIESKNLKTSRNKGVSFSDWLSDFLYYFKGVLEFYQFVYSDFLMPVLHVCFQGLLKVLSGVWFLKLPGLHEQQEYKTCQCQFVESSYNQDILPFLKAVQGTCVQMPDNQAMTDEALNSIRAKEILPLDDRKRLYLLSLKPLLKRSLVVTFFDGPLMQETHASLLQSFLCGIGIRE